MKKDKESPFEGMEEGRVLLSAVRVDGGVDFTVDEEVSPELLASLLATWLDQPGMKKRYGDAFIALATHLVEERLSAERIARWGRGFRQDGDGVS